MPVENKIYLYRQPILMIGFAYIHADKPISLIRFAYIHADKPISLIRFAYIHADIPISLIRFAYIHADKPISLIRFAYIHADIPISLTCDSPNNINPYNPIKENLSITLCIPDIDTDKYSTALEYDAIY